ncbi:MAG: NUDIX domain-containing protein [Bacteroidota bacterium]
MKEYLFEDGQPVDIKKLEADLLPHTVYEKSHAGLVQFCHDILVEYNGGILLVKRTKKPATDILWSLGGRVRRGMSTQDSAILKVKEESNLEVVEITFIDFARTFFQTDPFEHGRGTDTVNALYFAKASGKLQLDNLHTTPIFIAKNDYTEAFRSKLHPYMRDFMDKVIPKLNS